MRPKATLSLTMMTTFACGAILFFGPTNNASADTNRVNDAATISSQSSSLELEQQVDQYIEVKNNQYVLAPEAKNVLTAAERATIQTSLDQSNACISDHNLTIDPTTKTATSCIDMDRSYGKNSVSVHWNYVRIYLDKGMANGLKGSATAVAGFLAGKVPNPYVQVAAVGIAGFLGTKSLNNGIWFDFNFLGGGVTNWGWQ